MSITAYTQSGRLYYRMDNLNNAEYSRSWIRNAKPFEQRCFECNSEGRYAPYPPYYQLGPQVMPNCPYYNYILPNVYPKSDPPILPYSDYWYYPFERKGC